MQLAVVDAIAVVLAFHTHDARMTMEEVAPVVVVGGAGADSIAVQQWSPLQLETEQEQWLVDDDDDEEEEDNLAVMRIEEVAVVVELFVWAAFVLPWRPDEVVHGIVALHVWRSFAVDLDKL